MGPLDDLQVTMHSPRTRTGISRLNKTWHIESCVLQYLPRGFVLDGKRKVLVNLSADMPDLASADRVIEGMRYVELGTISSIDVGPIDFAAYRAASRVDRDEIVLSNIEQALTAIAREFAVEPAPIAASCSETRKHGFSVEREIARLSRSTSDRALRVNVFRRVAREGISWRLDIRNRKGELMEELWPVRRGTYRDVKNHLRSSRIEKDVFVLVDEIGKDRVRIKLRRYRETT